MKPMPTDHVYGDVIHCTRGYRYKRNRGWYKDLIVGQLYTFSHYEISDRGEWEIVLQEMYEPVQCWGLDRFVIEKAVSRAPQIITRNNQYFVVFPKLGLMNSFVMHGPFFTSDEASGYINRRKACFVD